MNLPEVDVLATAAQWLEEDVPTLLATVAATRGSAPRPVGSIMAINSRLEMVGSVSGGCVENDLLEAYARRAEHLAVPEITTCRSNGARPVQPGVLCDSEMTLVVERLIDRRPLLQILERIQQGHLILRRLELRTGDVRITAATEPRAPSFDGTYLTQVLGPRWQLILIGANDLARCIAVVARPLGFAVRLCEPRELYRKSWNDPQAPASEQMPDDFLATLQINDHCAVVALSHDPKIDDMGLIPALQSSAFYVGAVGSRLTSAQRRDRLGQMGLADGEIERLRAPAGVPIGSRSPPEIAISILAEVVAARNRMHLERAGCTPHPGNA